MSVSLSPVFNGWQGFSIAGLPLAGGLLNVYLAGTSTPVATYTDSTGGTANANPIQLDGAGLPPNEIWLTSGVAVKFVLTDALGLNPRSYDNITNDTGSLSIDLANIVSNTKGAALVGLNLQLLYPANTVGAFARQMNTLRKYGPLFNDKTTDDSATFLAAIASGDPVIDARGVGCFIGSTLQGASNQVWLLEGAALVFSGSASILWRFATKDHAALLGSFSITGDGSTIGTSIGIDIVDSTRVLIDMPVITNVRGWGIYIDPGSSTSARGRHTTVRSPIIESCYIGWEDVAGTGAEYCTLENPRITLCTTIGMKTSAGNTLLSGGHIVDNVAVGQMVVNGPNAAHGIADGVQINHNGTYDVQAVLVVTGYTWADCHIYQGDVWFDRCKGMQIDGGHFDPASLYNYKDGSSGMNRISNAYFPGSYGPIRAVGSNDGHDQLIIDDTNWGPGTYAHAGGKDTTGLTMKDPSTCYVLVQRDPAATQALTSATPATLTFSTANYLFDRRGVQSAGTFTIPADQAGIYRVDADLLFGGTAVSTTASFVEMKVNGTTKKELGFPSVNSTTKLQIQGSFDFYFNGSDAVTFVATITATAPVTFGDGTWPSNISLKRIA